MPHLNLALLGPIQLALEEPEHTRIESDKVRGLLAFLAVEHDRAHPREALAELLWPGRAEQAAAANFRRVLANLRAVLYDRGVGSPHLRITRATVQFDLNSDVVVDVVCLRDLLKTPAAAQTWAEQEQAIALYRGPFLEGFTLPGCPEFEQWVVDVRSELDLLVGGALQRMADYLQSQGNHSRALALYKRSLLMNPYHEVVHRKLMLAYAAAGQRKDVRSHYETYKRQLQDELGAQPDAETTALYNALQAGQKVQAESAGHLGTRTQLAFVPVNPKPLAHKLFAGREHELALMNECARTAISNHGAILLVVGEAGSGKSVLLAEFARRLAGAAQPWMVATGASTALIGIGDPYQPVVDALRVLAYDEFGVHRPLSTPETLRLLQEEAPYWASMIMAGEANQKGVQTTARPGAISPKLATHAEGGWLNNRPPGLQIALFDQLAHFLTRLARHAPLLLALDNLHWADAGTLALVQHLTQRLNRSHVLIAGAYRPGALTLEQGEHGQFARQALYELRRHDSVTVVDLDRVDSQRFMDALLDRAPNRFDESFRTALYRHTEGHALFTVEMLHALAEHGAMSQDRDGRWMASGVIDWSALPPSIEVLIGERLDRLSGSDRRLLEAACVQGDEFNARIAAALSHMDDHLAVARLSGDLSKAHRVVAPSVRLGGTPASGLYYCFRHHLFQAYLYNALDEGRRAWLHRGVGAALEEHYSHEKTGVAVTPQTLAWHYIQAGEHTRAVSHLRVAGQDAMAAHAHAVAVDLLTRALALTPSEDFSARFELLAMREQAYTMLRDQQARAQDVGELDRLAAFTRQPSQQLVAALRRANLAEETTHYWEAITNANAALRLSVAAGDVATQVDAHLVAGRAHWWRGEIVLAHDRYTHALRSAQAAKTGTQTGACWLHLGVAAWSLGDMAGANAAFSELLEGANSTKELFLRGAALMGSGMVACTGGEYGRAEQLLDAALILAHQAHHPWLEGQVLLNQIAVYRLSMRCTDVLALYSQLRQHSQAIDDRWTATAAQTEVATLYIQLGLWQKSREVIAQAMTTADELSALMLKLRLMMLRLRLALATGETLEGADVDLALAQAQKLGVASVLAEAWLLGGLVRQRQGRLVDAAVALIHARSSARGDASRRLLPDIVCAQADIALALGDAEQALACVAELIGGSPPLLIDQSMDPSSLYMTCYTVLNAVADPWAELMLIRGRRLLIEQANRIADIELRRSFCEDNTIHQALTQTD